MSNLQNKIKKLIAPLRPVLHRLRILKRDIKDKLFPEISILYGDVNKFRSSFNNRITQLLDRMSILESQINWRLHGLPSRMETIKLEQAPLLAGTGEIEKTLAELATLVNEAPVEELIKQIKAPHEGGDLFLFGEENPKEMELFKPFLLNSKSVTTFFDSSDLFGSLKDPGKITASNNSHRRIKTSLLSASALFVKPEFDFIWLSSVLERITPIQAKILIDKSRLALKENGVCAAVFQDYNETDQGKYWIDPRRVRPITAHYVQSLLTLSNFKSVNLIKGNDGYTLIICQR